ncbi:MAG: transposase [Xanthomonadaceae bacterium]|nr:transposase [Xanthomonadaceae bacterium]
MYEGFSKRSWEEFEHFGESKAAWATERFFKHWTKSPLLSRLEPMRKFVHVLRRHQQAVVALIDTRGINRVVRMVNNRASDYRNLDAFSDMIYLAAGDLDLPEQIPERFRTL